MSPLLRIITFAVSIIMSLLPIITIIAYYYYVFETGQLADESDRALPLDGEAVQRSHVHTQAE
jgi:hypothetical protein